MIIASRSIAGHHPECPYPFEQCACIQLYRRDRDERDGLGEAYREFWDPDWGTED